MNRGGVDRVELSVTEERSMCGSGTPNAPGSRVLSAPQTQNNALGAYDRIIGLDLSEVAVDGSQHKAPCGGPGVGPNLTDRARGGWKWSVGTDREGIPVGWAIDGANRHDVMLFEPTLDQIAQRGLIADIETIHLDKGYDCTRVRDAITAAGIDDAVIAKRRKPGDPG